MDGLASKSVLDRIEAFFATNTPTTLAAAVAAVKAVVDAIQVTTDLLQGQHISNQTKVYPTLANGVLVTGGAGVWVLGASAEIVPANGIAVPFYVDALECTTTSGAGQFEIVLYHGAADTEFARFRTSNGNRMTMRAVKKIPANDKITAKLATLAGGAQTMTTNISYHP